MDIKATIVKKMQEFVLAYEQRDTIRSHWGVPLAGFADANHPDILKLREIISPHHVLPHDVLPDASVILAYFVPFTKAMALTNAKEGLSSPEWAVAYEETNAMFGELNDYIIALVRSWGYKAAVSREATTFDRKYLISNWSQRHIARVAGLGTFGLNNMLITKVGCCGRYSTVVTNLDVVPDEPLHEEYCLYKSQGLCGLCVEHCPSGALTVNGYDRKKCFQVCLQNAEKYKNIGSSYTNESNDSPNSAGSEVCGKCVVAVPCSFWQK
ncbi:MAG: hypothetical protein LKF74_01310 [Megasphaera sp.]|jgi:epoxyqueuosine reductase QueG|nr:hypothetical protein [Megasphaera sp.]MCH4187622.1 hypothetical protein [Megasphaera sp.]MCH4217182.1 hypothetical protein [Megasphaera sp.]